MGESRDYPEGTVAGDRAHYAADLAANVVVLIGVVSGALLKAPGLDAAAGLVVAVWLAWGAVSLLKDAAGHLLDRAASDEERAAIIDAVRESEEHARKQRQAAAGHGQHARGRNDGGRGRGRGRGQRT